MKFTREKFQPEIILETLIEINYLAIIFFLPLVFAIFLKNSNIFELNKIIVFRILTWLLALLTLAKIFFAAPAENKTDFWSKRFFLRYLLAPVIFFAVLVLSLFFSIDPANSFYGLYDRQEGLLSYLFYGLFFALMLYNLSVKSANPTLALSKRLKRIALTIGFSSLIVSIYGILQIFGIDYFQWNEPPYLTQRTTSTFGQPNFLGSFLVLACPLIFYLFAQSRKFLVKFFWLLAALLELVCLFYTASRGAWLGLFLALIIVAAFYFWPNRRRLKKKNLYQIVLAAIAAVGVITLLCFNNNYIEDRIAGTFDLQSGSISIRMSFWQAGLSAIKARPLLGYGLENQSDVLTQYYQRDWGVFGNVNAKTNRAHNLILDWLLTAGSLGLAAYLLLVYLFFRYALQNIKKSDDEFFSLALFTGLAAYLISLLFSFPFAAGQAYFWLFFAIIFAINARSRENTAVGAGIKNKIGAALQKMREYFSRSSGRPRLTVIKVLVLAVFLVFIGWRCNEEMKILIADHYFEQMQSTFAGGQDDFTAYILYGYVKDQNPRQEYYDQQFINYLYNNFFDQNALAVVKVGQDKTKIALGYLKGDSFENLLARAKGSIIIKDYEAAQAALDKMMALSPHLPESYFYRGDLEKYRGHYGTARKYYNLCLNETPDPSDSRLNSQHLTDVRRYRAQIYKGLAETYTAEKNFSAARENYNSALLNYFDLSLYKKIADTYYQENNLDKAIWYNSRAFILDPGNYSWPEALAFLYKEKGDKPQALSYAQKAFSLNSSDAQVKALLDSLK